MYQTGIFIRTFFGQTLHTIGRLEKDMINTANDFPLVWSQHGIIDFNFSRTIGHKKYFSILIAVFNIFWVFFGLDALKY